MQHTPFLPVGIIPENRGIGEGHFNHIQIREDEDVLAAIPQGHISLPAGDLTRPPEMTVIVVMQFAPVLVFEAGRITQRQLNPFGRYNLPPCQVALFQI